MKVELLQPDVSPSAAPASASASAFAQVLDRIGTVLGDATKAEDTYAIGTGSLQNAEYRRAQADITLAVATAAVQRAAQAVQTLMNVQI